MEEEEGVGEGVNGKGSKYAGMLGTRAGRGRKVRAEWGRMGQNACQGIAYLDQHGSRVAN